MLPWCDVRPGAVPNLSDSWPASDLVRRPHDAGLVPRSPALLQVSKDALLAFHDLPQALGRVTQGQRPPGLAPGRLVQPVHPADAGPPNREALARVAVLALPTALLH